MTTPTHTHGPWHVNYIRNGRIVSDTDKTDKIQISSRNNTVATVYHRQDASLIHAAPDLLAALEDLTAQIDLSKLNVRKDYSLLLAHAASLAAIRKATE